MMLASALIFLAAFSALQAATVPVVNHAPATAATVQDTDSAWSLGTIEIAGLGGGGRAAAISASGWRGRSVDRFRKGSRE